MKIRLFKVVKNIIHETIIQKEPMTIQCLNLD